MGVVGPVATPEVACAPVFPELDPAAMSWQKSSVQIQSERCRVWLVIPAYQVKLDKHE